VATAEFTRHMKRIMFFNRTNMRLFKGDEMFYIRESLYSVHDDAKNYHALIFSCLIFSRLIMRQSLFRMLSLTRTPDRA